MAKFFISYSRSRKDEVRKVVELLRGNRHEVWWDGDIPIMADWWATILDKIEWCDVFLFVISEKSVESAYCRAELKYAADRQRPILPLILEDQPPEKIPPELPRRYQWFFYNAAHPKQMWEQINEAYEQIDWKKHTDIAVQRPSEPLTGGESLAKQFQEARRLANEQQFDAARSKLMNVKHIDYGEWGNDCDEWLGRITSYQAVAELADHETTHDRARDRWKTHVRQYGSAFDPAGIGDRLNQTRAPRRLPLRWIAALVVVVLIGVALLLIPPPDPTPPPPGNAITAENAAQVTLTEGFGRGRQRHIAWSPDGDTLAVSTNAGIVWLVDANSPDAEPRPLEGHTAWIQGVAFDPTGTTLASASADTTIRFWDVASGAPSGDPLDAAYTSWARGVAYSPDGRLLATVGCWSMQLFDISNYDIPLFESTEADNCDMTVAVSPDSNLVAYPVGRAEDEDAALAVYDVSADEERVFEPLLGDGERFRSVAFSPDGTQVAAGGYGSIIYVWDAPSGELLYEMSSDSTAQIWDLVYTHDGQFLISSTSGSIRFWDLATGEQDGEALTDTGTATRLALHPDGTLLASISDDGFLRFWNVESREAQRDPIPLVNARGHAAALAQDGTQLVASYDDGSVILWDTATGDSERLGTHSNGRTVVAVDPSNPNIIASGGADDIVRLYDLEAGEGDKEVRRFERTTREYTGNVNAVAFSPDGEDIAAALDGTNDVVRIWPTDGSSTVETVLSSPGDGYGRALSVRFDPTDGRRLAVGYAEGTVVIWNTSSVRNLTLEAHPGDAVWALAFSPDGRYLATGSDVDEGVIRIWDAENGEQLVERVEPSSPVRSLAFSPDGSLLAAGIRGKDQVWLFDTREIRDTRQIGEPLPTFAAPYSLAFSPDGSTLAVNGDSGRVMLYSPSD